MAAENRRWFASAPAALSWRQWDGEFVFFDAATGATHLLDAGAAGVLIDLAAAGADGLDLRALLGLSEAEFADPTANAEITALQDVLTALQQAGLAQSRSP
jgi:hypothetical protein